MRMQFNIESDNSELIIRAAYEQIQKALKTVGMQAEKYAKEEITKVVYNTPESPNYKRTGNLRNSITHQNDNDTVYVGTDVEYAIYVEMGTSRMKARPYIGPAIVNHVEEYKQTIEMILKG